MKKKKKECLEWLKGSSEKEILDFFKKYPQKGRTYFLREDPSNFKLDREIWNLVAVPYIKGIKEDRRESFIDHWTSEILKYSPRALTVPELLYTVTECFDFDFSGLLTRHELVLLAERWPHQAWDLKQDLSREAVMLCVLDGGLHTLAPEGSQSDGED